MQTKEFTAKIKTVGDPAEGTFEAYASTYDTDTGGDKVVPGAFQRTLSEWAAKGKNPPLLWTHDIKDPFSFIGDITDIKETDKGLNVKGKFDLSGDNPKAIQVHKLVKGGRVGELSFMYSVKDQEYVGDQKDNQYDGAQVLLKDLDLHEVTVCALGMNRATHFVDVKDADRPGVHDDLAAEAVEKQTSPEDVETKAGRTISGATASKIQAALQSIQDALETLETVLGVNDSDDAPSSNSGKSQENQPTNVDEESEVKAEADEPKTKSHEESVRSVPALRTIEAELFALELP